MLKIKRMAAVFTATLFLMYMAAVDASGDTPQQNAAQPNTAPQSSIPAPALKCKSAVLVEASTGKILFAGNEHEKMPPASITKIMTELLTLEAIESGTLKWDEMLTCSPHAASMGGSDIWLEPGEQMSVRDLFKAMAIGSANDAAVMFAEKIGGSEQGFVSMMNKKAKELGMNDTNFVNANGLDADGHVTSAYDIMLMSRELIRHKEIFDFCTVWMDSLRGGKTALFNTNKLIHSYQGINGLKTGSTGKAGFCLSATAKRGNMQLIAVVMGSGNSNDRFDSASALLDYGFGGWSLVTPKAPPSACTVNVLHGEKKSVEAVMGDMPSVLVTKGKEKNITQKLSMVTDVEAPVDKGQVLGQITLWSDGQNVGTVPLKAKNAVGKITFGKAFLVFMSNFINQ